MDDVTDSDFYICVAALNMGNINSLEITYKKLVITIYL